MSDGFSHDGNRPDRQHARVAIDAFVRVLGATGDKEYVFRTRDLSRGGLFLYTRIGHLYPFQIGSALQIELYDFDKAVEFQSVVVRVVEPGTPEAERFPSGFGIRIVQIDTANRERLDALLDRAEKGENPY